MTLRSIFTFERHLPSTALPARNSGRSYRAAQVSYFQRQRLQPLPIVARSSTAVDADDDLNVISSRIPHRDVRPATLRQMKRRLRKQQLTDAARERPYWWRPVVERRVHRFPTPTTVEPPCRLSMPVLNSGFPKMAAAYRDGACAVDAARLAVSSPDSRGEGEQYGDEALYPFGVFFVCFRFGPLFPAIDRRAPWHKRGRLASRHQRCMTLCWLRPWPVPLRLSEIGSSRSDNRGSRFDGRDQFPPPLPPPRSAHDATAQLG